MACSEFEDRLVEYEELSPSDRRIVDEHLQVCVDCREYLRLLQRIDTAIATQLREMHLHPGWDEQVRQLVTTAMPVARVSRVPEWLDLVAAGAVCAFVCGLVWQIGLVTYLVDTLLST